MGPFLKVRAMWSKRRQIVVPAVPIDSEDDAGSNETPWTMIGGGPFWTVPWYHGPRSTAPWDHF